MANAPNTGSTLSLGNGTNKTSTSLSTNILITILTADGVSVPVGAVQSIDINESRSIQQIDEVGTDGHIDSTPNKSTNITGSCKRIRFDAMRMAEAFSRGFLHVHSQVYPFDIVIVDRQRRDAASHITTVIKNVWIKDIGYSYSADNFVITDTMSWEAERIFSVLPGAKAAANGGILGIKHAGGGVNGIGNIISGGGIVNIEQLSDTGAGGRGGSLDASGLIDIGGDGSVVF